MRINSGAHPAQFPHDRCEGPSFGMRLATSHAGLLFASGRSQMVQPSFTRAEAASDGAVSRLFASVD